jgi:VWFA-related protein
MGGGLLASLLLFCLSSVALSQEGAASNPVPTQPPGAPLHVGTPSSDSQASAPATTLRKEVRLVVDAVVLDKKGAPVTGLKAGDFVLKEDGVAQTLTSVEEHKGDEHGPVANESAAPDGTISASNKPLNSPAVWNVLLVDQFNTTSADQANMLRQLDQFVKQLPVDQRVALVAMSSQVKLLVPFADGAGAIAQFLGKNGLPPSGTLEPPNIVERGGGYLDTSNPDVATNKARTDVDRQAQHAQKTEARQMARQLSGTKECVLADGGISVAGPGFKWWRAGPSRRDS